MRRAALLAMLLTFALSGVADAGASSGKVTGQFTLVRGWFEEPDVLYTHSVTLTAHTNPTRGTYTFSSSDGMWFNGIVTCLIVSGSEAWIGGPATSGSQADTDMFFHIRDGGRPSQDQVVAVVEVAGTGVADCESMDTGYPLFPVTSGNATVFAR